MQILMVTPPALAMRLGEYLERRGHAVDYAATGTFGLLLAGARRFDAIVVVDRLWDMEGGQICRSLRRVWRSDASPLILLELKPGVPPSLGKGEADVHMVGEHSFEAIHAQVMAMGRAARDTAATAQQI